MELSATFSNVILKILEKKTSLGMIALPDSAKEDSDFCEVVSVGELVTRFKVGELVLRPDPAEYEYGSERSDERYLIVPETSIVAVRTC